MQYFEIKGKGRESGRKRKRVYYASNEAEARLKAEKEGTLVEEITELPPSPPDLPYEWQLKKAKDLKIPIPPDVTSDELRDLTFNKENNDKAANELHKDFGKQYGVKIRRYLGKKKLFDKIHKALIIPGREKELLSWFAFRVYRNLMKGSDLAPIKSPNDPLIKEIVENLTRNEKIIKSIRRYQGEDLIWFGEWVSPSGYFYQGGSKRTFAYKEISSILKEGMHFPDQGKKQKKSTVDVLIQKNEPKKPNGCFPVLMLTLFGSISIMVLVTCLINT